jgi:hypothetical protein
MRSLRCLAVAVLVLATTGCAPSAGSPAASAQQAEAAAARAEAAAARLEAAAARLERVANGLPPDTPAR